VWIWIANKFAKCHAKRINWSKNIQKSFLWLLFWNTLYNHYNVLNSLKVISEGPFQPNAWLSTDNQTFKNQDYALEIGILVTSLQSFFMTFYVTHDKCTLTVINHSQLQSGITNIVYQCTFVKVRWQMHCTILKNWPFLTYCASLNDSSV